MLPIGARDQGAGRLGFGEDEKPANERSTTEGRENRSRIDGPVFRSLEKLSDALETRVERCGRITTRDDRLSDAREA